MKQDSLSLVIALSAAVVVSISASFSIWLFESDKSESLKLAAITAKANSVTPTKSQTPIATIKRTVQSKLRGSVYFETGDYELSEADKKILNKFVADIAPSNEQLGIKVVGHSSKIGGEDSNQQLSDHRARVVLEYLKYKVKYPIFAEGKGYNQLLASYSASDRHNQRVDFYTVKHKDSSDYALEIFGNYASRHLKSKQ
ncbi:OmpA family protein [Fischerella sp. PCC 9605]|uniref:OmpA family protein n=1 Tax=Fischerella sp. PCC 9605 TaxID=1173024 RepID=UPI00047E7A4C|nr:OmpA family protein [Fischerella sp. PCC 9605]